MYDEESTMNGGRESREAKRSKRNSWRKVNVRNGTRKEVPFRIKNKDKSATRK